MTTSIFDPAKCDHAQWNDGMPEAERDTCDNCDPPEAYVATGYMGDPSAWCYWAAEYDDEGSCGPFATRAEAVEHANTIGYRVEPERDILKSMTPEEFAAYDGGPTEEQLREARDDGRRARDAREAERYGVGIRRRP